ncbi:MAG: hypothetical protein LQ349_008972 [Xanthoria aureola]|nr:MAG: hypothetical protein LQ349_008972 [Xanthoria aureola]
MHVLCWGLSQLTLCTLQAAESTTHHQQLFTSAILLRLQKQSTITTAMSEKKDLPSVLRAAARKAVAKARAAPKAIWAHCKKQTLQLGKDPSSNKPARPAQRAV